MNAIRLALLVLSVCNELLGKVLYWGNSNYDVDIPGADPSPTTPEGGGLDVKLDMR